MMEIRHPGYSELTEEAVVHQVPSAPGVFMLAVRLVSGVHHIFHAGAAEDLQEALLAYHERRPETQTPAIAEYQSRFRCYYAYTVIHETRYRHEFANALLA